MRRFGLLLIIGGVLGSTSAVAQPSGRILAIGEISERGRRVRGQGDVLRTALGPALTRSGAYTLLANASAVDAANKKIVEINSAATTDDQWVELGHSLGATHLLLGEVRAGRRSCIASAQIITLETKASKPASPRVYDCTPRALVRLARVIAAELVAAPGTPAPADPPLQIAINDGDVTVDGRRLGGKRSPTTKPPAEPPVLRPPAEAPPTVDKPDADVPAPPRQEPPRRAAPPTRPKVKPPYTVRHAILDLKRHRDRIVGAFFIVPLLFTILGAVARRTSPAAARGILRKGMMLMFVMLLLQSAGLLFYTYLLDGSVWDDFSLIGLATPALGLGASILGSRLALRGT